MNKSVIELTPATWLAIATAVAGLIWRGLVAVFRIGQCLQRIEDRLTALEVAAGIHDVS